MSEVSVNDVYEFISKDEGEYYFIDIRAAEDFDESHAEGAINHPSRVQLTSNFPEVEDKNVHIFFMCYLGNTSLVIQNLFVQNVFSVSGGAPLGERRDYQSLETIRSKNRLIR